MANTQTLIVILAFVGAFSLVLLTALPFLRPDRRAARIKAVAKHREELMRQQREHLAQQQRSLRDRRRAKVRVNLMAKLLERVKLQNMVASEKLKQRLAAAGLRHQSAVITFVFTRLAVGIGGAAAVFLLLTVSKKLNYPILAQIAMAGGAGVVGFYFPNILIKNAATKRQDAMKVGFPDMLDLLVICVEGGLSVEAAFTRVTEEIADSAPILSQEIGLLSAELTFLGDRRQAYSNFFRRSGLPAARTLATSLIQSDKYGTPVGTALKVLAQENRDERMARAEKKAGALPAQLTVPMIVFFLPVLFLVILGPPMLSVMAM